MGVACVACAGPIGPPRSGVAASSGDAARAGEPAGGADLRAQGRSTVDPAPEIATGYSAKPLVLARRHMAVASHALAAEAAGGVLERGGSAVDAAIAAQMVLNVVEPQSSGIGGGGFMLRYEARTGSVSAYDGRETAPAGAGEDDLRWISDEMRTPPRPSPRASGRSIGTPGLLRMLEMAHRDAGHLPWRDLFRPAIRLASDGFLVSARMAASIADAAGSLRGDPEAASHFLESDGSPKPAGTLLKSPALAATLARIADEGADAFYGGALGQGIVDEVRDTRAGATPGAMTLHDLAAYRSKKRDPLCTTYRAYVVCGMPPPSSGGLAVAQTLGILRHHDLASLAPAPANGDDRARPPTLAAHLIAEAQRLAYADRDRHVADPDFVALPGNGTSWLTDESYLRGRAALIDMHDSMGTAQPGEFGTGVHASDARVGPGGTAHLSIVDADGNVVAMTTSIESAFGSYRMTRGGFLLNNQLTDFSPQPRDGAARPIANRMAPGKRPRSSMAPTLVFERRSDGLRGPFVMATGSPGGGTIIQYVVQALVATLDWGLDPREAAAMVSFGAANGPDTHVGSEHPALLHLSDGAGDELVDGLRALGHRVVVRPRSSGLATIVTLPPGGPATYAGAADPRREGAAVGDGSPAATRSREVR